MLKKLTYTLVLVGCFLLLAEDLSAQCAMCKAVTESSSKADPNQLNTAGGINQGIIYIMFIPYLLLGFLFMYFFRKKLKGFFIDMGLFSA